MQNYIEQQIDRYRITERLGVGGMAVVYKAYDTRLERDVALKLIRTESIPQNQHERLLKRFEREAKAQARFSHPNIVPIHDYGEVDGIPYLVMEYVPGGTLKDKLKGLIDYKQAIHWLLPIADALQYAHDRGIIHRDIKPSNILFDETNRPILTDFGIAKILETDEATLTGTGLGVGTPEYMAPEQWQGKPCAASDQYALGVVLYELITGQKPYTADTPAAIILMQATEPLPAPSKLTKGVPDALEKVLYKALAKTSGNRYEDMAGFKNTLQGLLVSAPGKSVRSSEHLMKSNKQQPPAAATRRETPSPQPVGDSEGETQDALEIELEFGKPQTKSERIPTASPANKNITGWGLWAGIGTVGLILTAAILAIVLGAFDGKDDLQTPTKPTITAAIVFTETNQLDVENTFPSPTPTLTKTASITPSLAPTLGIGSVMINEIDDAEMVFVPAGNFILGNSEADIEKLKSQEWCTVGNLCQENTYSSEIPSNVVYVDSYWINIHEVTKGQYNQCVETGVCDFLAEEPWSYEHFGKSDSLDYPVLTADWFQANTYCEWIGGRLPTEAEWEKAARGTDGRIFPWGDSKPTTDLANFNVYGDYVSEVGSYPAGASPYGALDMAGNVWEWVSDWFQADFYATNENWTNPTGPQTGTYKVMRGGSTSLYWAIRTTTRFAESPENPDFFNFSIGFRCVIDETP